MIKTILCAVDLNWPEREKWTLQAADGLARLYDAQLDVITVLPDPPQGMVAAYLSDHNVETAHKSAIHGLNRFAQSVVGQRRNSELRHVVSTGRAYAEVLNVADKDEADLIVIGAQNEGVADYLLGTNAAKVVRHAKTSVWIVRA